ncbi:MAG TPA: NAD-dependent epimerase/dehydratase family protein [Candidatus Elarobacter sp.]|jgi:UDP-glucose 4-epimerase|nr:NAD-dependent epimerase/dehydratase family protein [Candidatus Elarobacter sp.]
MLQHLGEAPKSVAGLRCTVLGGGGFLGRRLASALCEGGAAVEGFGHGPREGDALDERVRWTEAGLADGRALRRALDGADVVFHLIGPPVRDLDRAPNGSAAADGPTSALLDACVAARVRKVVFASSGGAVYGVPPSVPTTERAPVAPVSAYGAGCAAIERRLESYRRRFGLGFQSLRIANAYGPGQSPFRGRGVAATTVFRALAGLPIEIWGSPATTRDFVHVDDVASAFAHAAVYHGDERIMNVGTGRGTTLAQLVADVTHVLELPHAPIVVTPPRALAVPVSVLDAALITRSTGWRPRVPWFEGLADTARWQRAAYGLR